MDKKYEFGDKVTATDPIYGQGVVTGYDEDGIVQVFFKGDYETISYEYELRKGWE
ncbi:hypothetical protein L4A40_27105 [Bacillus cereus]|uniref:hypothetical protein n=1 Tax=Bacillus cereus TaxID=1396 RepID=UPI001F0F6B5A|nr:hypothetical protein [Bacillus cereus]MCH5476757.1 hypothetical protein [Bacillus cereus]